MAASPTVVLVETEIEDLFSTSGSQSTAQSLASVSQHYVRRPMRGLQVKRETFATLSINGPGAAPAVRNSAVPADYASVANFTSNFILQGVTETRMEKFQAVTTFGAPYGFFFGEQPRMIQLRAVLLNTADFQWEIEWWTNYEEYFRGTQLANRGMRAYLSYDDVILEGYLTQATTAKQSAQPYQVDLSFSMWVTNVIYLINPGDRTVDPIHATNNGNSASLEFDNIEADGSFVSLTEEARSRNIAALTGSSDIGLLSALRSGLDTVQDFVGDVGDAVSNAVDFLYGRNLVIPAGFAGSEATAGNAVFASGSGFEALEGADLGILDGSLNIKVPGVVTGAITRIGDFYDNVDEYPARSFDARLNTSELDASLQEAFGVGLTGTSKDEQNRMYIALAESTFAEFGYDISNEEGSATSDTLRALGRAAFAAISYASMTTGLSQDAASLTVIGGTTGNTNAAEQQAALEELNT